jgi:hypothetical protein
MSKLIKIYCEGKAGSHDYDILAKTLDGLGVLIEPIGSKKGAGSAIQVYEKLATKSDAYLFFRDRDFDAPIPNAPSLSLANYTYYSYRITIENYLFSPKQLYDFAKEKELCSKYSLNSEADVKNKFIEAAKTIAYYQAIRHTMGKMRTPTDFGTTWLEGSGQIPTETELQNKNFCREKAWEKISETIGRTNAWTEQAFNAQLEQFYQQFSQASFYDNCEFLIWFQGKDFATALSRLLPNFPMNDYEKFAKDHFDYTNFPDLVELRQLVLNLME